MDVSERQFPPFDLARLLKTVFAPRSGERIVTLIDLPDLGLMRDFRFLEKAELDIQRHAHDDFYLGLKNGALAELGLEGGELYAYAATGGSNLDLPEKTVDAQGRERALKDVCKSHSIVLCVSTYSATAPLTALARELGFRGATLHGVNDIILKTGLAVDYEEVSRQAEKLRLALTGADQFQLEFEYAGQTYLLTLDCAGQEAQKSHGLCRGEEPDVANLPAGEVYFVPAGAEGEFPQRLDDGTIGLMEVRNGRVARASLLSGDASAIEARNRRFASDPVTGELGELGFGTQELPPSGRDIQDEKILGTFHVATGRSDHLGGSLTPERFADRRNATHDDILFSPTKTPEIRAPRVRMTRGGREFLVLENYKPAAHLTEALSQ